MKLNNNAYSFAQSLHQPHIKLNDFIAALTPLNPTSSINEKAIIEACKVPLSSNLKDSVSHLVHNLIFKQFANTPHESVRELVSNAIDAQVRSKRQNETVEIFLSKKKLIVEDQGDGLGWKALINYFVPGRSSNPVALFNLKEGIPNVTGRFGQGGLAIFSYLLDEQGSYLPTIEVIDGEKTLKILYFQNEILEEAVFTLSKKTCAVNCRTRIMPKETLKTKKLTIYTNHAGETLKLKFWGIQGAIVLDIKKAEKILEGTRFTIRSPLFEKQCASLEKYLADTFRFVRNTPLSLNGKQINTLENFCSLQVEGLTLFYSNPATEGTLFVCEGGKVIISFKLEGSSVPEKMAIDFEQLPLTQDRSTLDVKDTNTIQLLTTLIEHILTSSEMGSIQKGMLLNALYPLLDNKQFNLLESVKSQIIHHSLPALPDIKGLKRQAEYVYLKPEYLSFIKLPAFHEEDRYILYLVDMTEYTPIDIAFLKNRYHLFLDRNLFSTDSVFDLRTKFAFVNQWLKNKKHSIQLHIEGIINSKIKPQVPILHQEKAAPSIEITTTDGYQGISDPYRLIKSPTELIEYIAEIAFPVDKLAQQQLLEDFLGFEEFEEYEQIKFRMFSLRQTDFWKQYPKHFNIIYPILKNFMWAINEKPWIHRQELSFVYETLKKSSFKPKQVGFILNPFSIFLRTNQEYLSKLSPELQCKKTFAFLLEQVKDTIEINSLIKRQCFTLYLIHNSIKIMFIAKIEDTEIADYYDKNIRQPFVRLFKVSEDLVPFSFDSMDTLFGCTSDEVDKKAAKLIEFKETIAKILDNKSRLKFLSYMLNLEDVEFWKGLNNKQLNLLANLLPSLKETELRYTEKNKIKPISAKDYLHLLSFAEKVSLPLKIKAKWACIFFYMMEIHNSISFSLHNSLNIEQFLKLLTIFARSKKLTKEEFEKMLEDIRATKQEFRREFLLTYLKIYNTISDVIDNSVMIDKENFVQEVTQRLESYNKFRGFESVEDSVKAVLPFYANDSKLPSSVILKGYLNFLEKIGVIKECARPFMYAAFVLDNPNLLLKNYISPLTFEVEKAILLQQDKDVIEAIGSEKLAAIRIQGAQKQISKEGVWILEILKNSRESESSTIEFSSHADSEGNFVCVVKDDGMGINLDSLKALKSPGTTSKIKEGDNPNFGWGFFTLFRDFSEVQVISTTADGINIRLIFKKIGEDIFLQTSFDKEVTNDRPQGVTLILKKKAADANFEAINLNSQIVNYSQYLKDVTVKYAGSIINNTGIRKPEIEYSEPYSDKGEIKVQIGWWEGGIYFNDNRIDYPSEEFLSFLPEKLRECLTQNKCELSVFLPSMQQIMNRSQLIHQEELLSAVQMTILNACFQYATKNLHDGKAFNLLSEDYWNDFRIAYKVNDSKINNTFNASKHEVNEKQCSTLVSETKQFFNTLKTNTLSFPYQIQNIDILLQKIIEQDKSQSLQKGLVDSKVLLKKTRVLSSHLVSSPLHIGGISLSTIREALIESLTSYNILKNRAYNEDFILNNHPNNLTFSVKRAIQHVKNTLNLDDHYKPLLKQFLIKITEKIDGHHVQAKEQAFVLSNEACKPLKHFMMRAADTLLDKKIRIHFFAESNGVKAYTRRKSNDLYINKHTPEVQTFLKFLISCQDKEALSNLDSQNLEIVVSWLETLVHEIVHMSEESGCEDTHDKTFYKQMALLFEKMLASLNTTEHSSPTENALLLILKELHSYIPSTVEALGVRQKLVKTDRLNRKMIKETGSDGEISDDEIEEIMIENEYADQDMTNHHPNQSTSPSKRKIEEIDTESLDDQKNEASYKKHKKE